MNKTIKKELSGESSKVTVPQENQISNFDPASQVEFAQKAATALMVVIDATKPLIMQNKRYLYFEHWQTIARFFNTTVGTTETIKDPNGYIAKAAVYNKDGVIIGGAEASCMKDELNWKSKPDFQLRSMAQTRAMSKALRSIYGFVAVLAGIEATPAEEMQDMNPSDIGQQNIGNFPPSEKQFDLITKLMEDKGINDGQVIDAGFDFKNLTGGKGGTASELIEWLFAYNTRQFGEKPDFSLRNELDVSLGIRIDKTDSLESLNLLGKEVALALKNKKITKSQFVILVSVGAKRRAELEAKDPGIVNPGTIKF